MMTHDRLCLWEIVEQRPLIFNGTLALVEIFLIVNCI